MYSESLGTGNGMTLLKSYGLRRDQYFHFLGLIWLNVLRSNKLAGIRLSIFSKSARTGHLKKLHILFTAGGRGAVILLPNFVILEFWGAMRPLF